MIDELLFKTNHLGKDGFIWWIGQVAPAEYWKSGTAHTNYKDPDKERKNWPERCKVRIIGYHTFNKNELKDEHLPLAHIMMDPVFGSGQGGEGINSNLQGGEVCFGFFLDGEDAQQPVIMGLMSRPRQVLNETKEQDFAFRPFTGYPDTPTTTKRKASNQSAPKEAPAPPAFQYSGNKFEYTNSGWATTDVNFNSISYDPTLSLVGIDTTTRLDVNVNVSDYLLTSKENAAYAAFLRNTTFTYIPPSECNNNFIGQITQILQDFIGFTNGIQKYANSYIDPVLNEVVDIGYEIKVIAGSIGGIVRSIINSLRGTVIKCVTSVFKNFFNTQCEPLRSILSQSFKNILNIIYCLLENLIPDLLSFLERLLSDLVDNVFSAPLCAVNQWVAGILSKVMDSIDNALSDILSGIRWLTESDDILNIFKTLNKASSLASQIYSYIGCDDLKCTTPSKWVSNIGPSKISTDNWESMVGDINVIKGISEDVGSIEAAIAGTPLYSNSSYSTGIFVNDIKRTLLSGTDLIISSPGAGFTTGITTFSNVDLISLTGEGKGAKAKIGVGTGVVFYASVTKEGQGYKTGDTLTLNYRETNNQGNSVVLTVPRVRITQNSYYKPCADRVNNPINQDDLPLNDGNTKLKKCVPPKIEVYGDGEGANIRPIISGGKLIHAEIISPGFDYTIAPTLTVVDKSGYGKGAKLISEIDDKGSIKDIIVLDTGTGYCPVAVGSGSTDSYDIESYTYVYVNASRTRIYEGESVSFIVTFRGEDVPNEVNYQITGVTQQKIKQQLTGSIKVENKTANITIETIVDDNLTSDILEFKLVDFDKTVFVLVDDITENPLVSTKDYILSSDLYSINEGSRFKITLKTRNVEDDTIVPFNIQVNNQSLIQNYSSYSSFKVNNNKSELTFQTNKGVITNDSVIKLELENKNSSVRVLVYKLISPIGIGTTTGGGGSPGIGTTIGGGGSPGIGTTIGGGGSPGIGTTTGGTPSGGGGSPGGGGGTPGGGGGSPGGGGGINTSFTPPTPQLCLTRLKAFRPGYGYNPTDTATDGINTFGLIVSPDNGAIFGVKSLTSPICGYDEPPIIEINTTTGIGGQIIPIMRLDRGNSNSINNVGIKVDENNIPINAASLTQNPNTTSIITGISSGSINIVDCI